MRIGFGKRNMAQINNGLLKMCFKTFSKGQGVFSFPLLNAGALR